MPPVPLHQTSPRRKSADVGGLALALQHLHATTGSGWGGWVDDEDDIQYAETLCDMYTQTTYTLDLPIDDSPIAIPSDRERRHLITILASWSFEPNDLTDDQALLCTQLLFESLLRMESLQSACNIEMDTIVSFLRQLRAIYRSQNHYHNFKHALDVLQACYLFLSEAGLVPPVDVLLIRGRLWRGSKCKRKDPGMLSILRPLDMLALYIAAIGHDVGHPGLNNAFMRNAKTPLSVVYDDQSALEQMHCALLMHIMRRHDLGHLLKTPFKRLLHGIILATDMSLHPSWMATFKASAVKNPVEEETTDRMRLLCCQAIIKCADISNPARPHSIAWNWASALHSEWATQAQLEDRLGIQISVNSPGDAKQEATGQIGFITYCTLPLFQLCTIYIPCLKPFTNQCESNLRTWQETLQSLDASRQKLPKAFCPKHAAVSPDRQASSSSSHQNGNGNGHFDSALPFSLPSALQSPSCHSSPRERKREIQSPSVISISPSELSVDSTSDTSRTTRGEHNSGSLRHAYRAGTRKRKGSAPKRESWVSLNAESV